MKNTGGRHGGSITAALFIQRFVNGVPWAHLDIAATAWKPASTVPDHPRRRHRLRRAPARPPGGRPLRGLRRRGERRRARSGSTTWSGRALDQALPELLEKTLARGWKALVRARDPERLDHLDGWLWSYRDDSFLPHGVSGEADGARASRSC